MRPIRSSAILRRLLGLISGHRVSSTSSDIIFNSPKNSTNFVSPALKHFSWIFSFSPCFPLHGDQIKIIAEPMKFYETLVNKCANSKERIVLASLYLGTGHLEAKLFKTIETNLKRNAKLKVSVLLDFSRGTRGEKNSKIMLMPLVENFGTNVLFSLYHTPILRGWTKWFVPPRWNEIFGVQHMKVYVFDDSLIISGANLSNDYFINRQDRYFLIEDKDLADFYAKLLLTVQEFSLIIEKKSKIGLHKNWTISPYEGSKEQFSHAAKLRVKEVFCKAFHQQQKTLHANHDADTWIFPLVEMGQIGIHHESFVTKRLLSAAERGSKMKLATGYFNLTQDYMDTLTYICTAQCSILMAHPNANGFQGARGPAGSIPAAYSLLAKHFYECLMSANQDHRVKFFEYKRRGWSYHAKGLWYYLPDTALPCLTLIGSSNFGERSVNRDVETQICIMTTARSLQIRLQKEVEMLYFLGSAAESEILSRNTPFWVRATVKIFRNFF